MLDEHLLDGERAVEAGPVGPEPQVDRAGRTGADVNANRNIEFLGHCPVRLHPLVIGCDAGVLVRDLAQHGEPVLGAK